MLFTLKLLLYFLSLAMLYNFTAVQSERKPADSREKPVTPPMATSSQRLYVRKDLRSPLAALPTFSSDKVCLHSNNLTWKLSWENLQKNIGLLAAILMVYILLPKRYECMTFIDSFQQAVKWQLSGNCKRRNVLF